MAEQDKEQLKADGYELELDTDLDDNTPDKPSGMALQAHEAVAVLRVAGIGQSLPSILNSISQAMEVLCVGHRSGNHGRFYDHKRPIGHFFEMNCERRLCEPWQGGEEGSEEFLGPARADDGQRRPCSSLIFRKDHRIEEIGDEV